MKYIRRIEEVIAVPPYKLGTNDQQFRFEATRFTLQAERAALEAIIDNQLHAALPNGTAVNNHGDIAELKYTPFSSMMLMTFLRYWRVESKGQPEKGWLSYTEVLLGFYIERKLVGSDRPNELFLYVGTVHIDDSYRLGQLQDPDTMPIVLGREAWSWLSFVDTFTLWREGVHDAEVTSPVPAGAAAADGGAGALGA